MRFSEGMYWASTNHKTKPDSSLLILSEILTECKTKNYLRWYLKTLDLEVRLRNLIHETDALEEFLSFYESAAEAKQEEAKAFFAYRIGQIYGSRDAYAEAVKYHLISLNYYQNSDDKRMLGLIYRDLNYIHAMTGEAQQSIDAGKKGLPIFEAARDTASLIQFHVRFAEMYLLLDKPDEAKIDLDIALTYSDSYPSAWLKNYALSTSANYYKFIGETKTELQIREQILQQAIDEESTPPTILSEHYSGLADAHLRAGNLNQTIDLAQQALNLANVDTTTEADLLECLRILSQAYHLSGKHKEGYDALERSLKLDNELYGSEQLVKISDQMNDYQQRQKEISDSLLAARENQIFQLAREAEISKEKTLRNISFTATAGLLVIAGFLIFRTRRKRKNNSLLHEQKLIAEAQKTDIIDSIKYAKRIQTGILPSHAALASHFKDTFILYQPKDIVSGDFYWTWFDSAQNKILLAVADCTGHGVPGAMVSVICNMALNRAVKEFHLTEPNEILDKVREIILEEFEKSTDDVKDGMDVSLIAIQSESGERRIKFAGANNPLWIIRKGDLIEIKGDKQPVGKYYAAKPFTLQQTTLEKDDRIYLFSDGFADQFGGEQGKKLKAIQFRKTLLEIAEQDMPTQEKMLRQNFENWRGTLEQVDDVCVIGVKI